MSKTIQITIRPLDYYFFGSNETFEYGAKGIRNFSVKSNPLPQQTGLLGLLRHAFFCAGYEIGESFNPGIEDQHFGFIHSISPLYLVNSKNEVLYKCPPLLQEENNRMVTMSLAVSGESAIYNNRLSARKFSAINYNPKNEFAPRWLNIVSGELVDDSTLFCHETHIGIDKGKTNNRETDEGAFYKQQFYRLKNCAIAFQAVVDGSVDINKLPGLLPFGGEKKMFSISYTENGFTIWSSMMDKLTTLFSAYLPQSAPCVLLLTDAYVSSMAEMEEHISYAVLRAKAFRNIRTPKTVTNFSRLGSLAGDEKQLYKPVETTYLLKQGSLLFADGAKKDRVVGLLGHQGFTSIGYNQFIRNF